ncbi:polysaccharide pyruvyl transferase family protein [Actibacterium lipolyticum]|uniref:Colanic acid biosynthesis protein n=1 Tax=Actibacterium lipolyticum TaxID=1524263 RepID=A0A238KU93_9RHOB|nr:polysaccharide pyruvyl transferase family protein [Actibacterium lipolyticum]SMX46434.1 colanic acid biosynthesis protein [Actibacterium lipolyticum]
MVNICLILHSTKSDNLGVGALTVSDVAILREVAQKNGLKPHFTIIDWKDPREPYVVGDDVEVVPLSAADLLNPTKFFRLIRRADMVVDIGVGDSFADIYGNKRLMLMFLMKFQTHLARRPLVIAPQTIGPFTKGRSKLMARVNLKLSKLVCTRDKLSTACLSEIGYTGDAIEACDVALKLPFTRQPSHGGTPRIGLNVSGLLMNGGYSQNNMFGLSVDYPHLIRETIRQFQAHPDNPEIILVPHVISDKQPVEDDYRASEGLVAEFPGVKIAPKFADPSEAKSLISGLDFFAGARMHSCIAAFSSGVAVVPMAYSRKFEGLFGSLGYSHTVDCKADDEAAILSTLLKGYENRAELAKDAEAALAVGLERLALYEAALGELMLKLPVNTA